MKVKLAFEEMAEELGMILDCKFFEPFPNYCDSDTKLAYKIFEAGWESRDRDLKENPNQLQSV